MPVHAPRPPAVPGKGRGKGRGKLTKPRAARTGPPVPVDFLLKTLRRAYPAARCSLDHENAFQLLVSTILSAQCTDERVNKVTPDLFRRWPDARAFADADLPEIEEAIRSTGFFRSKARSISEASRDLVARFGARVPRRLEDLVTLRGVGRKTANVVLGNAFGIEAGVVVDTHVGRLARRLGLTKHADPVKVERDLMAALPQKSWTLFSHLLIHHGRAACQARKPRCSGCPLAPKCPRIGVRESA